MATHDPVNPYSIVTWDCGPLTATEVVTTVEPAPRVGEYRYATDTAEAAIYDGHRWVPLDLDEEPKPCGRYKGRKLRQCLNCGFKYPEHDEGKVIGLRDQLLALRKLARDL